VLIAETARTRIRPWRPDEADRLFDMLRRPEVARWLGVRPDVMRDRSEAVERIAAWSSFAEAHPGFGRWAVEVVETGVPAGTILLGPMPNGAGEVEIGWHFHPDSWGKGLASEAAAAVLAKAFADGISAVYAVTHPDNIASHKVCERIGMANLGETTKWYGAPAIVFCIRDEATAEPGADLV
jgi:RimJ/RimL family protein N-acetyltransferase